MTDRGARPGTAWAWGLAATPLVSIAALEPVLLGFQRAADQPAGRPVPDDAVRLLTTGFRTDLVVSVALVAVAGLLSWLDHRRLAARGIPRPFPWGWGFLHPVYLIGRTVVLLRRTGHGAGPLILWAGLFVAGTVGAAARCFAVLVRVLSAGSIGG